MGHAFEVNILGPQCRPGESRRGQDDAVGQRQATFVCEPRRLQGKRGG